MRSRKKFSCISFKRSLWGLFPFLSACHCLEVELRSADRMRGNFFFSSAQVICRTFSDSNSTMIDFFSLALPPLLRGCHLVSNYMLGSRLIDCLLTLLMLNLKAAAATRLSGRSINSYRIWACPLPGGGIGEDKGVGGLLVSQSRLQNRPEVCKLDVLTTVFRELANKSIETLGFTSNGSMTCF